MLDWRPVWIAKAGEPPACGVPVRGGSKPSVVLHPIKPHGEKFFGMDSSRDYQRIGGDWLLGGKVVTDENVLARLHGLSAPSGWREVHVSFDPNAKLQVLGFDTKGRVNRRYLAAFDKEQAEVKFARVRQFSHDLVPARAIIDSDAVAGKAEALLTRLEDKTAIRIGTNKDLLAKQKAYGLTTLEGRHVSVQGTSISLDFIGKEGKQYTNTIQDGQLANWLAERKSIAGDAGRLFPDVNAAKLNNYVKETIGPYSIKDFRTYHATRIALNELKPYQNVAMDAAKKKEVIKSTLDKVSTFLNNSPAMARKSYIDPTAWGLIGGI